MSPINLAAMEISFDPEALHETSWLYVFSALQIVCFVKLMCVTSVHWTDLLDFIKRRLSRNARSFVTQDDEEKELINARVRQCRLALAFSVNSALLAMWLIICMVVQVNILVPGRQRRWISAQLAWLHVVCFTFFALGFVFPSAFRLFTLDLWYVMGMTLCTLIMTPVFTTLSQCTQLSFFLVAVFRVPAVLVCTRPWLVVTCNLALFLMMELRIFTVDLPSNDCDFSTSKLNAAIWELFFLIFVSSASFVVERHLRAHVSQGLLVGKAATELTAASSLLQLTCDAVVELDEDLRLTAQSSDLEAMLLRGGRVSCLQGRKFSELMPTRDESERTVEILRADNATSEIWTNIFHTRMMDSCSSKFRTEVFHVKYRRLNGRTCHLIGLRDFTDQASLAGHTAIDSTASRGTCYLPHDLLPNFQKVRRRSRGPPSDQKSDSSVTSNSQRNLLLQIDMGCRQVVCASVCIASFAGKLLTDLFGKAELDFLQQVWHQVQALDRCNQIENKELNFGNLEIKLGCRPVFISGQVEVIKQSDGQLWLQLRFSAPLQPRWDASRASSRSSSPSSERLSAPNPSVLPDQGGHVSLCSL